MKNPKAAAEASGSGSRGGEGTSDANKDPQSARLSMMRRSGVPPLTPQNLFDHPCVATKVTIVKSKKGRTLSAMNETGGGLDASPAPDTTQTSAKLIQARGRGGKHKREKIHLTIHEEMASLGRGASGATFRGDVVVGDDGEKAPAAVKMSFVLLNPTMYGLATAADVETWAKRELYPEVNTLLALAHPHIVSLRCVGLQKVCGKDFPGYIAMHLCNRWVCLSVRAMQATEFTDSNPQCHLDATSILNSQVVVVRLLGLDGEMVFGVVLVVDTRTRPRALDWPMQCVFVRSTRFAYR